jgi:predicted  nucleic acid-binding Zn-ribbon protein
MSFDEIKKGIEDEFMTKEEISTLIDETVDKVVKAMEKPEPTADVEKTAELEKAQAELDALKKENENIKTEIEELKKSLTVRETELNDTNNKPVFEFGGK